MRGLGLSDENGLPLIWCRRRQRSVGLLVGTRSGVPFDAGGLGAEGGLEDFESEDCCCLALENFFIFF